MALPLMKNEEYVKVELGMKKKMRKNSKRDCRGQGGKRLLTEGGVRHDKRKWLK